MTTDTSTLVEHNEHMENDQPNHVCPWWMGYVLLAPLRKLREHPDKIFGPMVKEGMTVLDIGSGMGYFSLPLARMVGEQGKVLCVDMEPRMLRALERRMGRVGFSSRLETIQCTPTDLGLAHHAGQVDVAAAVHMVHEVPRRRAFLAQVIAALKPGGKLLIMEPRGHVSEEDFNRTLRLAREAGLKEQPLPFKKHKKALAALFSK
jgi:ubiquinone/menaquinone biosynthesis C-methylase UbiE